MSSHLWRAYYEDDPAAFRQLLAAGRDASSRQWGGGRSIIGSPGQFGTSPARIAKARKVSGQAIAANASSNGVQGGQITKADINWRDAHGLTLLHLAASSTAENAINFATALLEHPLVDVSLQDFENGWTALHRAFYFGNIAIARSILERDAGDALGRTTSHVHLTTGLIKVKDREGHGPLDLYAATIKDRTLRPEVDGRARSGSTGSDEEPVGDDGVDGYGWQSSRVSFVHVDGDEFFTFGSNRNVSLGFGDEDDRQFPERITLRRPEHLLRRFYREHVKQQEQRWSSHDPTYQSTEGKASVMAFEDIPWVARNRPLIIQDVRMAKLDSAVLTSDPESNLYMCGHGKGGRLGTGDERTRFSFVCIEGGVLAGKKVGAVALGQNHTLAVSDEGEIFSWGNNGFGQLGYSLPKAASSDEDPISVIPRQIFGPLKREIVTGIAASRIHSVAYCGNSLHTFGKNEGQLGIMDSDARSLEIQVTPRKVAASLFTTSIAAASATDQATVCLLDNHDVWVFANYGYAKVAFPLEGFTNYFLKQSFLVTSYDTTRNRIVKITSGGDTICALSSRGEIFTLFINRHLENQASASTTNPVKIRSAIMRPQCIWSLKRGNMAARDVGVDADGSIILATEEGSVWKRTKRAKINDATAFGTGEYKPKDYKFSRIPGLTRVLGVRASAYGAYAAIRRECNVLKTQIVVEEPTLWKDLFGLLSLKSFSERRAEAEADDDTRPRFWQGSRKADQLQMLKRTIIESEDIEVELTELLENSLAEPGAKYDAVLKTSTSDLAIPVHRFVLTSRSRVLRRGFRDLCETSTFTILDLAVSELDDNGRAVLHFQGLDILTVIDLVIYLYTDTLVDFWHLTRNAPAKAHRYRQVRTALMKVASKLELMKLEPAVRQMVEPKACLDMDLEIAFDDHAFFYDGDILVQLEDDAIRVHSALVCARCPFFAGLFMGRAGGRWLAGRDGQDDIKVDLTHINSKTFHLVLRHIYADTGDELFDDIVSTHLDDFLDTIMDVLGAANELMLDRLSQLCQSVIGRYANLRNVCGLLNVISPSSVHGFKHAGLEYLCLSVEALLQGHYLNELDDDLLRELDNVVRQNQLACMPFAKSDRAESMLLERHPELAAIMDRNKQAKLDAVALRSKYHEMETFRVGHFADDTVDPPIRQKARRPSSSNIQAETQRPYSIVKESTKELMFAMDEESDVDPGSPMQSPGIRPTANAKVQPTLSSFLPEDQWYDSRGYLQHSPSLTPQSSGPGATTPQMPRSPGIGGKTPPNSHSPWRLTPLSKTKTDLRGMLAQAATSRSPSLGHGPGFTKAGAPQDHSDLSLPAPKLSQKERKKMQHAEHSSPINAPSPGNVTGSARSMGSKPTSPWQTLSYQKVPALKDVLDTERRPVVPNATAQRVNSTPQLTMRQTVANAKALPSQKPVIGPAGQAPPQQRRASDVKPAPLSDIADQRRSSSKVQSQTPFPALASVSSQAGNSRPIPQSVRHQPRLVEPSLQLSMCDIVEQQQLEKDVIKEAATKRDLHDIQAEQEFQEWWEKESQRVQEAEQRAAQPPRGPRRHRGRGGRSGKGGKGHVEQSSAS